MFTKGKWTPKLQDGIVSCYDGKTQTIICNVPFIHTEEAKANARLIASAPELLELSKNLLACLAVKIANKEIVNDTALDIRITDLKNAILSAEKEA